MTAKAVEKTKYTRLTPILSDWMKDIFADFQIVSGLFEKYNSPVNLHHLKPFGKNYLEFAEVLEDFGLNHTVYFARKANKCAAFCVEAKRLGFGVDTAGFNELKQCLELGISASKLVLTAAVKEKRLIKLAIESDVLIIVDNLDEIGQIEQTATELSKNIRVGVRIGGFEFEGETVYTRFGFTIEKAFELITEKFPDEFPHLKFEGLHFHLNGYSRKQRGAALVQTIELAGKINKFGLQTKFIDIGGGFLVNYLEREGDWNEFHEELKSAFKGERETVTFANDGLGMNLINGEIYGEPKVYPYFNKTPRSIFLKKVLEYKDSNSKTVAELLRENNIELRLEPGRSLLDQTGMTIARVAFRKQDFNGDWLIGLEMNRTQMFSSSADFLLEPTVIYKEKPTAKNDSIKAFFVGAYCLEQEFLLKRKIKLEKLPEIGDAVCFPNTAGYMMHFFESEAHLFDLAENLIFEESATNKFITDKEFAEKYK